MFYDVPRSWYVDKDGKFSTTEENFLKLFFSLSRNAFKRPETPSKGVKKAHKFLSQHDEVKPQLLKSSSKLFQILKY